MAVSILLFLILFSRYYTCQSITDPIIVLIWIAVVINVFCIASAILAGEKIYSAYVIYLAMFLIFIFGQMICRYVFGYLDQGLSYLQVIVEEEDLKPAIVLATYCLLAMNYGAMLTKCFLKEKKISEPIENTLVLKTFAKILCLCTIPFVLYDFVDNLSLAIAGGYKGVYSDVNYGLSSIMEKIVPYFFIALLLLLYSYRKEIKKARIIMIFTVLYSGIQMIFGARGILLLQILVTIILWSTSIKKPSKKLIVSLLILVIPMSYILSFIGEMRNYPVSEWKTQIEEGKLFEDNFILKIVNEMGIAIYPTAAAIVLVPDEIPYKYGATFVMALTTIIPNLGEGEHFSNQYTNFTSEIAQKTGGPFGGSIVQEGFVNYGWYCPIFFLLFASLLIYLDNKVQYVKKKSEIIYPLYLAFLVQLLWTVRNNLAPLIIYIIRYILPILILYVIFEKKIYKRKGKRTV